MCFEETYVMNSIRTLKIIFFFVVFWFLDSSLSGCKFVVFVRRRLPKNI